MRQRRPKTDNIPFAWYWEGRPLRGRQIRPVYTGTYDYQCQYPCCSPYQYKRPVDGSPPDPNTSRAKKDSEESHRYSHDPYCSPAGSGSGSGSESETEVGSGYECSCSLCRDGRMPSCCAGASDKPGNPSSIHYHAHAYSCCYPDAAGYGYPVNYSQSSESGACSCSWCQRYDSKDRYQCPDCLPQSPRSRYSHQNSTGADDGQYHHHYSVEVNGYQRKTTRAGARASAHEEVSEEDSADPVSSDCCSECDAEADSRAPRYPVYRAKKR